METRETALFQDYEMKGVPGGEAARAGQQGSRGNPAFSSSHPPLVRSAVPLETDGLSWAGILAGAGVQLEVQLEDVNLKDHVAERRRLSF